MKRKTKKALPALPDSIQGTLFLAIALFFALSLISYRNGDSTANWLGLIGHIAAWACNYLLGLPSVTLPLFCGWMAWRLLKHNPLDKIKGLYFALGLISLSLLCVQASGLIGHWFVSWVHTDYYPRGDFYDPDKFRSYLGGVPLHHLYIDTSINLKRFLGAIGTFLIASTLLGFSLFMLFELNFSFFLSKLKTFYRWLVRPRSRPQPVLVRTAPVQESPPPLAREDPLKRKTHINIQPPAKKKPLQSPPMRKTLEEYELPPASLLTEIPPVDLSTLKSNLKKQASVLEETLLSFGIEAKVGDIHCGPTVTSFEVHPAIGVKVQKIKTLEDDIALNMQARSIRIIAPIPGKAAVGIEVPNPEPQEVSFREMLDSYSRSKKKCTIPLLLGKQVNGNEVWADLTKMPHLIIAGATGSGKSVCINTIVMSVVMNAKPDEIKLMMVDPKKVELTAYTHLPHMLAPVITEPGGACAALGWLVKEMERRYEILRLLGIRNIQGFNTRKINKQLEEEIDLDIPERLPYLVAIIDELADLMMVASSDIETPIARIAQMARAVGIHLILATQRPSREVITGLIKANFPCRIAFKVSSRINSQIIIDENGAETLLGNGDMLFLPPGTSNLIRAQGAFIRDDDINQVIHYACSQASTNYVIPSFDNFRGTFETGGGDMSEKSDPYYDDAKSLVLETGNASTTFLQRKLKVGYARAASLMDQLEASGIIGPSEGAKPRKIFYPQKD